jgi:hypothetical protein
MPFAVIWRLVLMAMVGRVGVTEMDSKFAVLTVNTVVPVTPLNVAEMVEVPCP